MQIGHISDLATLNYIMSLLWLQRHPHGSKITKVLTWGMKMFVVEEDYALEVPSRMLSLRVKTGCSREF
jgi:hypothetical protein